MSHGVTFGRTTVSPATAAEEKLSPKTRCEQVLVDFLTSVQNARVVTQNG